MINRLLFYLLMFSDYTIGPLSISDYALILLLFKGFRYKTTIRITKRVCVPLALMLLGVFLSLIFNITKPYFVVFDSLTSTGKFAIYILAIYLVPQYLAVYNIDYIRCLKNFLIIASLSGVLQRLIVLMAGRSSWPAYSLGSHWFGLPTETTMFNNVGMMRSRAFWSEPAHFAIFISLIFILLLFSQREKLSKVYYVFYIIGTVCANSVSGYGIMVSIFAIYIVKLKKRRELMKTIGAGIVFIGALAVLLNENDYLRGRLINLFNMKDHSGIVRTVGGFHILGYIPWYGTGVGNHTNYYKTLDDMNPLWFSGSGELYNVILIAIVTMGYIGALGFILFQYGILKRDMRIFLCLMVTHFGWGKLYTTPVWIFLIIYIVLKEKDLCGGKSKWLT